MAVFDAVWTLVQEQHFDPPAAEDWSRARRERRPAAVRARDWSELYFDVLFPLLEPLDQSHVILRPPAGSILPRGRTVRLPPPRRGERLPVLDAAAVAGLGADVLWDGEGWRGFAASCPQTGPGAVLVVRRVVVHRLEGPPGDEPGGRYRLQATASGRPVTLEWSAGAPLSDTSERRIGERAVLLRFDTFQSARVDWLLARLAALDGRPLLLDLRSNGGGEARQLHRVASRLLPPGALVGRIVRRGRSEVWRSGADGEPPSSPVALLVGPRTASSAEILTAALRHAQRVPVVGQRTAGAVLFSMSRALPDGGFLTLPVSDFRDPDGARLEGVGVTPDREVASACEQPGVAADLLAA